jgi:4-amino-4-deoxy-L-arabinose transferase-like glycosyltransferase
MHNRGPLDAWFRPNGSAPRDVYVDLLWLAGLLLVLVATGIGWRDPWPADEPRFALVARDMVRTQQWLIPMVGGDLYPDKPPVFFWLIAAFLQLTGSLRVAFLLPSFLAATGCVVLVYDLGRRLWDRQVGFAAALLLLSTWQFVWQARQAQIDATLCFWTTLGLYGLLRHLLVGPAWRWYVIAWAAAGMGVITKGVGFLPLLVLIPYIALRYRRWPSATLGADWRWWLGPLAFVLAVSTWLVPMLWAAHLDPAVARYRDEILFDQTITRYAKAWHHRLPFWYYLVEVIPFLWLPGTLLVPWLVPRWRAALKERDLRVALLVGWMLLVIVFFSASSGKRGVYVLPAVPAFALACAPWLRELFSARIPRRALLSLVGALALVFTGAAGYLLVAATRRTELTALYDTDFFTPLLIVGIASSIAVVWLRARAYAAYVAVLACAFVVVSYGVNPAINRERSSEAFVGDVELHTKDIAELGLVAYKEQYLLEFTRPTVNFGHARWREAEQEAADAAAWLAAGRNRALLLDTKVRDLCFSGATTRPLQEANNKEWLLVVDGADPKCVARGDLRVARTYVPPRS